MKSPRETRTHLFECQIYHKKTEQIYCSGSAPFSWNGTVGELNGIKSDLLTFSGRPADLYAVRIISAIHLFGEWNEISSHKLPWEALK